MQQYLDLISQNSLFIGIPKEMIPQVLSYLNATVVNFNKNEAVFREGEPTAKAGIILSGILELRKEDYHGNRSLIQTLDVGEMFGEALCCTQTEILPVGIYAAEKCSVMFFDCNSILTQEQNNLKFTHILIKNLLSIIAKKNLALRAKINLLSKRSTKEKIMAFLLSEAKKAGKNEFYIQYDRQQLADYLGVDRSAMSAEIGKLCRQNVISTHKNHFTIINLD